MIFLKSGIAAGAFIAALSMVTLTTAAQEVYNNETVFNRAPTVDELNSIFSKGRGKDTMGQKKKWPQTRSIVLGPTPTPQTSEPPAQQDAPQKKENQTVSMRIQFDVDSALIKPEFETALNNMAKFMQANPTAQFEIGGHADATGTKGHNEKLSYDRAEQTRQFLVNVHNIEPNRLKAIGYGETSPLPGVTPDDARNRRVSFYMM